MADEFWLIYYDQRGRGQSAEEVQPTDITLTSDIDDVRAVMENFQLPSAGLLGHSWGTVLALEFATRYPRRISELILLNPAPASARDVELSRRHYAERLRDDLGRQKAIIASTGYQAGDPEAVATRYRLHFKTAVKDTWHYESLMATMHAGFAKQGSEGILRARAIEDRLMAQTWELAGYDLLARLGAVNIPTLLVNGDHDFIPAEISMHIAAAMPNAELVTLRDCGHFAYLERAAELREVIDDFFPAKRPVIRAVHNEGAAGPEA